MNHHCLAQPQLRLTHKLLLHHGIDLRQKPTSASYLLPLPSHRPHPSLSAHSLHGQMSQHLP